MTSAALDLSALRQTEFSRLDRTGTTYLDYTGAAMYPESLVSLDASRLSTRVMGNPHSESEPSLLSTHAVEEARRLTLLLLDADPAEYEVVFTANATGAMRILADAFPFRSGSRLVMSADNHNSVNGLAIPARSAGAVVACVPLNSQLRSENTLPFLRGKTDAPSLFAFPAQSNFSGVQHPLEWVHAAQGLGYRVLLDAAGYVPSSPLSLRAAPADFVAVSFYKIFGYPTGVGALVAKRSALATLRRDYFSGGTVQFVSIQNRLVRLKTNGERFEDGTANFLAMPAICDGIRWIQRIGMAQIRDHVAALTALLLRRLETMGNGVIVYGPRDARMRGGTVAFNLVRGGVAVPFELVESAARAKSIALRGGCFCNPGAAEQAFDMPTGRILDCLRGDFDISRLRVCLGNTPVGAVRASIGVAANEVDIDRLVEFLGKFQDDFTA